MAKKMCPKCGGTMDDIKFYSYKNGQKFDLCKNCLTLHVDNFDESTFLWIIEKANFPWVPSKWNEIREKQYAKKGQRMNGTSVLGKYFSQMRLSQWKEFDWSTSEAAQKKAQQDLKQKNIIDQAAQERYKQQFEKGEITEAQYRTLVSATFQKTHEYIMDVPAEDPIGKNNAFRQENFISVEDLPDPAADLTKEDMQYLALKWGRTYRPDQWITLQTKYTEMMNSFDIQDADSKNTLMFICKTYLKMNEAIDIGDVENYQKLSRVYDQLRKSMKVTAAQKKEESADFIDSVGQLVAFCEKNGHRIPEFKVEAARDIVDKVMDDMKLYTRTLVYEDKALARQIEDYIKEARAAAQRKKDREQAKKKGLDQYEITDQDILDYKDFLSKETRHNQQLEKGEKRRTMGLEEVNVLNNPSTMTEIFIPSVNKQKLEGERMKNESQ